MAEQKGIVTGIGDRENSINLINPQLDAAFRKFVIGKNAILSGLDVLDNNLTAGYCVLCGYVGNLVNNINNISDTYIYGKFILNFDDDIADEFYIETTDVEKTGENVNIDTIISAGTYYLLLYEKISGEYITTLKGFDYPDRARVATITYDVGANGTIGSTVTVPTHSIDAVDTGNLSNPINFQVANTEFVQEYIEYVISHHAGTINTSIHLANKVYLELELGIKTRGHYCLVLPNISLSFNNSGDFYFGQDSFQISKDTILFTLQPWYTPKQGSEIYLCSIEAGTARSGGGPSVTYEYANLYINQYGQIVSDATASGQYQYSSITNFRPQGTNTYIGYEHT